MTAPARKPKKMRRWRVSGAVHASTYLGEFEAPTKKAAEEMALAEAFVDVCHHCARRISDPEVVEAFAEEVVS